MPYYFRLIHKKWTNSPFGYGTAGGRWNPPGVPMVYAGSSVSLIFSEFFSIRGSAVLKSEWSLITFKVKKEHPELESTSLPDYWFESPYPLTTQEFGRAWQRSMKSACLKVPSARIPFIAYPREHILLINPLHPSLLKEVTCHSIQPVKFNINN